MVKQQKKFFIQRKHLLFDDLTAFSEYHTIGS